MSDPHDPGFDEALEGLLLEEHAPDSARARELFAAHPGLERRYMELRALGDSLSVLGEPGQTEIDAARADTGSEGRERLRTALQATRPDLARRLRKPRRWPRFVVTLAAVALFVVGWWNWSKDADPRGEERTLGGSAWVQAARSDAGWMLEFQRRLSTGARFRVRALTADGEPLPGFEANVERSTWQLPEPWTHLVEAEGNLRLSVELLDAFGDPQGSPSSLSLSSSP